jgi:3-hydroxyisobutyrate dehydrogenase
MALNLARAGTPLVVWNRTPQRTPQAATEDAPSNARLVTDVALGNARVDMTSVVDAIAARRRPARAGD